MYTACYVIHLYSIYSGKNVRNCVTVCDSYRNCMTVSKLWHFQFVSETVLQSIKPLSAQAYCKRKLISSGINSSKYYFLIRLNEMKSHHLDSLLTNVDLWLCLMQCCGWPMMCSGHGISSSVLMRSKHCHLLFWWNSVILLGLLNRGWIGSLHGWEIFYVIALAWVWFSYTQFIYFCAVEKGAV